LPEFSFLDPGEAEALALASFLGPQIAILLDDLQARSMANKLGLAVTGSAGIALRAKDAGVLTTVKPILDDLRRAGLFMTDAAIARVLEVADER
jgi:predicted nucleic acid-binding protein